MRPFRWLDSESGRDRSLIAMALVLSIATLTLVGFGWGAVRDVREAANRRLARRSETTLILLRIALDRDMKGAWMSSLVPIELLNIQDDPPYEFLQRSARAFARFPYLESFVVWKAEGGGRMYVFNRANRPSPWDHAEPSDLAYPVTLERDPVQMAAPVALIRRDAASGRRFAVVETSIGGVPYQIVAHLMFGGAGNHDLVAFVGFLVNLDWVRRQYFPELLRQIAAVSGGPSDVALAIADDEGREIATSGTAPAPVPAMTRSFPLLFIDDHQLAPQSQGGPAIREWTASSRPGAASARAADAAGRSTFLLISLAAFAALGSLLLVVRAARARAEAAAMKSEFVSMVTHELKTPLALIKLVGETLERGRYTSGDVVKEYAALLSKETNRLAQLIDNLLTLSRVSDLGPAYSFEAIEAADIVDDVLQQFWPRLREHDFDVRVDVSPGLPPVRVDRTAILHAIGNVIDNAIKYSDHRRTLTIAAAPHARGVAITVADEGVGIATEEIAKVFDKFYRSRAARAHGSGLGLTIARRVVEGHGGTIAISSRVAAGTRIEIVLPRADPCIAVAPVRRSAVR